MVKNACDAILGQMLPKNNNVVFVAIFPIISASKPFFGEKKNFETTEISGEAEISTEISASVEISASTEISMGFQFFFRQKSVFMPK